uniref:Uncharacterized protein n=1 Tax=Anguilla anguilla TaxID=7936 RepID=A0A0E9UT61_ANGAN
MPGLIVPLSTHPSNRTARGSEKSCSLMH